MLAGVIAFFAIRVFDGGASSPLSSDWDETPAVSISMDGGA